MTILLLICYFTNLSLLICIIFHYIIRYYQRAKIDLFMYFLNYPSDEKFYYINNKLWIEKDIIYVRYNNNLRQIIKSNETGELQNFLYKMKGL